MKSSGSRLLPAWVGLAWVVLLLPAGAKLPPAEIDGVERIVVLGDVHGNHDGMRESLELAGVIDRRGRWAAGRTHLVQIGDLPDRGPRTREASEFLQRLEKQARRQRGRVHVLIGNHEAMMVYGDLRYVTPEEYAEFRTKDSRRLLDLVYEDDVAFIKANNPVEKWPTFDDAFRREWYEQRPPGWVEHRLAWQEGDMHKWVLSRLAVLRLNRTLLVHAGIGPGFLDWTIDQLNAAVHEALANPAGYRETILREEEGPLWYRGLAVGEETAEGEAHLEALLQQHGVDRIIVGHTVTSGIILPRYGGRFVMTDVGISAAYGNNRAVLIIENEKLTAVHREGRVQLPQSDDADALLDYVERVAQIESDNPRIAARWQALQRLTAEVVEGETTASEDGQPAAH